MAFDLAFSSPISMPDKGKWAGGPGTGGHKGGDWTQRYGNDYGCGVGEQVYAAFDCVILGQGWYPNLLKGASEDGKKYGLQMIVANTGPGAGLVEAYYTHINDLAPGIAPGQPLSRGAPIGKVRANPPVGIHLHFAMHAKGAKDWRGVDIPNTLIEWAKDRSAVHTIHFGDDGTATPDLTPPTPSAQPPPVTGELEGYDELAPYGNPAYSCLDGGVAAVEQVLAMQRAVGNRGTLAALRSPLARLPAASRAAARLEPAARDDAVERTR
jgi:hypothetical protein